MKKIVFSLLFVYISYPIFAQYSETIQTARPGQAVGPFTTGKKVFQVQTGVTYGSFDDSDTDLSGDNVEHGTVLRYGLLETFEVRTAFRFRSDDLELSPDNTTGFGGLSFWDVGVRFNVWSGTGYQPSVGFQTDVSLNVVDKDYKAEEIAPRMMLIHSQKLSETFNLTTNWAVVWNGNDNSPKGTYVINIAFPISDKIGSFVENYGEIVNGEIDTRWDTGIGYLVNDNFQLDISAGFGENEGLSDWFVDGGISWRMKFDE